MVILELVLSYLPGCSSLASSDIVINEYRIEFLTNVNSLIL